MSDNPLLTVPEACRELRVSRATLYRLKNEGRIRFVHPRPGRTCVEMRSIEAYRAWMRKAA